MRELNKNVKSKQEREIPNFDVEKGISFLIDEESFV